MRWLSRTAPLRLAHYSEEAAREMSRLSHRSPKKRCESCHGPAIERRTSSAKIVTARPSIAEQAARESSRLNHRAPNRQRKSCHGSAADRRRIERLVATHDLLQ